MHRVAVLLAALLAAACTSHTPEIQRVQLPGLGHAIDVPVGAAASLEHDGAAFTMRPGTRSPRTFSVYARPARHGAQRRTLAPGVTVAYTLLDADGGSGGAEAGLEGSVQVGARSFAVTCHDQAEAPAVPDATWCFAWLATLRVDA